MSAKRRQVVDGQAMRALQAELLTRLHRLLAKGCWIIVDSHGLRSGAAELRLAVAEVKGIDCPVVLSSPRPDLLNDDTQIAIQVPFAWLAGELGGDRLVLVDPGELPGVRLTLASILAMVDTPANR